MLRMPEIWQKGQSRSFLICFSVNLQAAKVTIQVLMHHLSQTRQGTEWLAD
jgi:hypothetical protein